MRVDTNWLRINESFRPFCRKEHTQPKLCTHSMGTYATHRLYLLPVAIKSSTLSNPGCFRDLSAQMPNRSSTSKHSKEAPAPGSCLHLHGSCPGGLELQGRTEVSGKHKGGRSHGAGPRLTQMTSNLWKKVFLPLPTSQPQKSCSVPFPSRRSRQNPGLLLLSSDSLITKGPRQLITHHHGAV